MNPFVMLLSNVIQLYSFVVLAWAVLGLLIYFNVANRNHPVVSKLDEVLGKLVEPALKPIRRALPDLGGVDISPIVLLLLLHFLNYALVYYSFRLL